jgi:hypothetical protein
MKHKRFVLCRSARLWVILILASFFPTRARTESTDEYRKYSDLIRQYVGSERYRGVSVSGERNCEVCVQEVVQHNPRVRTFDVSVIAPDRSHTLRSDGFYLPDQEKDLGIKEIINNGETLHLRRTLVVYGAGPWKKRVIDLTIVTNDRSKAPLSVKVESHLFLPNGKPYFPKIPWGFGVKNLQISDE